VPEDGQQPPEMITAEALRAAFAIEREMQRAERAAQFAMTERLLSRELERGPWWSEVGPGAWWSEAGPFGWGPWRGWESIETVARRQPPPEVVERCAEVAVSPTRRAEIAAVEAMGRAAAERRCRVTAERRAARLLAEGR